MSREYKANRIHQAVADWLAAASDPTVTAPAPTPAAGSMMVRGSGGIHELYLKTAVGATGGDGWTRQNLTLEVFNVKSYGATGDGVTDDRPSINAAISACEAAGGGIVYFPPGQYAIYKQGIADLYMFQLDGTTDITFLGDGHVSQLLLTGDMFANLVAMWHPVDGAARLRWHNLYMDGAAATNTDDQTHLLQIAGLPTDPVGSGAKNIEIDGCFFGEIVGDAIRLLADTDREIANINIHHNVFNCVTAAGAAATRSCISVQRSVTRTTIYSNFLKGSTDNQIDFEPSGTSIDTTVAPYDFVIVGNQIDHQSQNTQPITIGGIADSTDAKMAHDIVCAFNLIRNGGNIYCTYVQDLSVVGNVVLMNSTASAEGVFYTHLTNRRLQVNANVLVSTDGTTERPAVLMDTSPSYYALTNNIARTINGTRGLRLESGTGVHVGGNILTMIPNPTSPIGIQQRAVAAAGDLTAIVGNMVVPDTVLSAGGIDIAANSSNYRNALIAGNYIRQPTGVGAPIVFESGGGGAYSGGYRYAGENVAISDSSQMVAFPTGNIGAILGGSAGPSSQIAGLSAAVAPNGAITSPPGSLFVSAGLSSGQTLWMKESGAGNTGWSEVGSSQIVFGVLDTVAGTITALFAGPGSSLAAADTVERAIVMPRACTIRGFRVKQTAGVGAGTITYTYRKNGANQSGPCTINFTATTGTGGAAVAFAAGDRLSIQCTKSTNPGTAPKNVIITFDVY